MNPDVKPFNLKPVDPPALHTNATKTTVVLGQPSDVKTTLSSLNDHQHIIQRQNEMILKTHQQMATAMLLPHAEVPNCQNDSNRLYYLHKKIDGPSKDLIGGCMFMDPITKEQTTDIAI